MIHADNDCRSKFGEKRQWVSDQKSHQMYAWYTRKRLALRAFRMPLGGATGEIHRNNNNLTALHKTTFTLPLTSPCKYCVLAYLRKRTYKLVIFYVCNKCF